MNIPARYCTGYLGDIGVSPDPAPMDFSAWYEVFLDGRWFTFDARHNHPRIGRIVIARGRDAADVAISTAFGPAQLVRFKVITEDAVLSVGGPGGAPVQPLRVQPEQNVLNPLGTGGGCNDAFSPGDLDRRRRIFAAAGFR
jgi:transglutaminase-like putative cysteine protease